MKKWLIVVLLVLGSLPLSAVENPDYPYETYSWYKGLIHLHTRHSDGLLEVASCVRKAQKQGLQFLVFTDHAKDMGKTVKDVMGREWLEVDLYRAEIKMHDKPDQFVALAGIEFSTKWKAESNTTDTSDTLALKYDIRGWDKTLGSLNYQLDAQPKLISRLNQLSCTPIAAHSTLIVKKSISAEPWQWTRMRYDRRDPVSVDGLCGIEFFNCATDRQNQEIVEWYLSLIKSNKDVFATSGCDSHGVVSTNNFDTENWKKITYVGSTLLNGECLVWGIRQGRTIATCKGFLPVSMTFWPWFKPQTAATANLDFTIECPKSSKRVTCNLFRDGVIIAEGQKSCQNGQITVQYKDPDAEKGVHRYVFEVEDCLITSPIVLDLR